MNAPVSAVIAVLCMASSALCAFLLVRSWLRTYATLLLWISACIVLLAVDNVLLVAGLLSPRLDLSDLRLIIALAAVGLLLFGFMREV